MLGERGDKSSQRRILCLSSFGQHEGCGGSIDWIAFGEESLEVSALSQGSAHWVTDANATGIDRDLEIDDAGRSEEQSGSWVHEGSAA